MTTNPSKRGSCRGLLGYFAAIPRDRDSLTIERMLSRAELNLAITVAIDTPSKVAISS